jgi:hypothetical protein
LRFLPLLQEKFGGDNDCSLVCITAIILHCTKHEYPVMEIYKHVESIAKENFYNENRGTMAAAIRTIFNKSAKKYLNKTSCVKYTKGVGYDFDFIKKEIDNGNPIILSLNSDGLDFYKNHSVTIIGYKEYDDAKILKIYDNWYANPSYLDYDKISLVSSVHCLCSKSYPLLDFLWKIIVSIFGHKKK